MTLTLGARISIALAIALALFSAGLWTGWETRGWKNDSEQAAVDRAADAITKKATANETGIAQKVEDRLATLKANEKVIDRGVIREIQNPIYRNVCLPDPALRMLNAAAKGQLPSQPAEPAGPVSGGAARVP